MKKLTTEPTEITEEGKKAERSFFLPILRFFLTQRIKEKNLPIAPLHLCTFAFNFSCLLCVLCVLCGLICVPTALTADPWGKDADLAKHKPLQSPCECEQTGPGVAFSELFIRFHQEVISPADGPRSHFFPSSSQYTLESIRCYGFFKGWMKGCDRLMRENDDPWVYKKCLNPSGQITKYDPVK